ncbi:MAG: hypothetical protein ACLRPW_02060 [Intestinibacter sp.]
MLTFLIFILVILVLVFLIGPKLIDTITNIVNTVPESVESLLQTATRYKYKLGLGSRLSCKY